MINTRRFFLWHQLVPAWSIMSPRSLASVQGLHKDDAIVTGEIIIETIDVDSKDAPKKNPKRPMKRMHPLKPRQPLKKTEFDL